MSNSGYVEHHPLVRVRGGATLLLYALVLSLPPPARAALRRLAFVIPVMKIAEVPRTAVLMFAARVLLPLLSGALPTASGAPKPVQRNPSSNTLVAALSHAIIVYSLAEKLMKVGWRASPRLTAATAASLSSEGEPLPRLLNAVIDSEAPSLPSALLSLPLPSPTAGPPRRCSALFSTTTPGALKAYLHYLHARPRSSQVTILVPGLLTAPWTTHLAPLLRDFFRREGTAVIGYDIGADAAHHDVDLCHMRNLIQQLRQSTTESIAASPVSSAAPEAVVLFLASIRGRHVRNRDEACVFAKMQGFQVVELCLPTLPLDAVRQLEAQGRPKWMSARQSPCTMSSMRPDLRLTAFDDAGMYGGAVVELCSADSALLMHMRRECQPGLTESRDNGAASRATAQVSPHPGRAVLRRTRPSSAVAATRDVVSGTSEFITKVWCPWAHRLCVAAWREANMLNQGSALARGTLTVLPRFPTQALLSVPQYAQAQLRRLLSPPKAGAGPAEDDGAPSSASHSLSADTPVEQRTTYITSPLAAAPLRAAAQPSASSRVDAYNDREGEESPTVARAVSPARAAAAVLTAPEEGLAKSAVEWRIRLQWSWLFMLPTVIADDTLQTASDAAVTVHTAAAYLSLWSFVAQLPPWVVAVSAADDGETARGERRSSCCVEAFATALLVRLAYPASPRAAAELLQAEALVEAAAVRLRAWDSLATAPDATEAAALKFEDAVVFPGCTQAARLGEELLYLPLSPSLPVSVRAAMLRVLWEKVPHAGDAASAPAHSRWLERSRVAGALSDHVKATSNYLYQTYLPQAQRGRDRKSLFSAADGRGILPSAVTQAHSLGGVVSTQDAERVQQLLFDGAFSSAASSLSATAVLSSLTKPLIPAVMSRL
ncbi:hypothetical protein JIQ42_01912 [Leishmania sp. Namibia]|uniref:hypothetical protein n=1 Tax=Leishmania sp. Namibia TaxID=2802991 RepID=UPI001B79E22F|nr:hypothetical protein JIQ42_01912 [Leishmania sp. Namibia]